MPSKLLQQFLVVPHPSLSATINGCWYKPFPWAIIPKPSNYKICASANSKFTIFDLETNEPVSVIFEHCRTPDIGSKCGQCSNISIIYSNEDLGFNVYSLDGKEVDLTINRYKSTGEVYDIEFNWLEIPKNGKATLRFSPEQNPNLEMEIDNDHNGIFDYRVSPDYVKFR